MTKSMRAFGSIAVVLALAVPGAAWAQAGPRGGTTSSGSSSGGSSGSAGGSSGGSVSEGARVSPPVGANGASMGGSSDGPSRIPRTSSSPSRTSSVSETTRVAPPPGGVAVAGVAGVEVPGGTARVTGSAASRFAAGSSLAESANVARSRGDNNGVRGTAGPRPVMVLPPGDYVSFPFYGPWGGWYPWCYSGFGWGLGFVYYDPWFYGATSWYWGRYGMWYDPYAYFGDPYLSGGSSSSSSSEGKLTFGSLRIKANVSQAKVYVDGALAGVVDEFDGLKDHLELETGKHTVELRADGYATVSADVVISKDKTKTLRLEMKKAGGESK